MDEISDSQKALRSSCTNEELLHLFVEHVPSALAMFDRDMRYLLASRRWRSDYGLGERELQGCSHYEIFPEIPPTWREAHRRGLAGEVLRVEEDRFERLDGSVQWVRWEIRPWHNATGEVGGIVIFTEDVTERKKAGEQLRKTALFPEENPFPVLRVGENGVLVYANRAAAELLTHWGCNIGKAVPDFVQQYLKEALESGTTGELEVRCGEHDLSFVLVPIGEGGYVNLYGRDLTERKRAEQKLRQSESRYRELVECANSAVVRWKADGTLTFFNEYAQGFFGYSAAEVIGRHVNFLLPDRDATGEDLTCLVQDIVDHPESFISYVNENICRDGRRVWMAWTNKPIVDDVGQVTEILAIGSDITERLQAEVQIRETMERLRLATNAAEIGIWNWNFSDDKLEWDDRLCDWYEAPEATQQTGLYYEFWRSRVHPDDIERAEALLWEARRNGSPWECDFRIVLPSGSTRYIRAAAVIEHDRKNKPLRMIGINRDVTPQRELEESLLTAKHAAEVAKTAAEEASRAKSDFLSTMSHEIRTPMTVFMGAIQHLQHLDRNSEHGQLLEMADQASKRLYALVSDILDFSKIESRRVDIDADWFDLWSCLRENVAMMTAKAQDKGLRLELQMSSATPKSIVGDQNRLGQVLINLIDNAIKFTDEGEVKVAVQRHDGTLEFTVSDTGIGIPIDKLEKIFETFSQVDSSSTRRHGGTGLGLAISRGLVELMGGRIGVRSRLGQGSVFTFTLPMKSMPSQEAVKAEEGENALATTFTANILIVDDHPLVREMVQMVLSRRSWQTSTAANGRDAIRIWQAGNFDVILMDLHMPGMNGLDTTREIRRLETGRGKSVGIIGLTADANSVVLKECIKAGMNEVLVKPFEPDCLEASIERYLAVDRQLKSAPSLGPK